MTVRPYTSIYCIVIGALVVTLDVLQHLVNCRIIIIIIIIIVLDKVTWLKITKERSNNMRAVDKQCSVHSYRTFELRFWAAALRHLYPATYYSSVNTFIQHQQLRDCESFHWLYLYCGVMLVG